MDLTQARRLLQRAFRGFDLSYRVEVMFEEIFRRRVPRRLEESLQMFLRNVLCAEFDRAAEVDVVGPVRAGRDLIEARFVEVDVRLHPFGGEFVGCLELFNIEFRAVVPVALKNAFRHALEEFFSVMPIVVRPDPRSDVLLVDRIDEEEEIVPPQLALADNDVLVTGLVPRRFFVVAEMEEPRRVENLADFFNQIRADLVIFFR